MLYFTLPEMVNNLKFNTFLINLHKTKPEYFKFNFQFFSINGNFNYTLWNGELNNNFGEFSFYKYLNIGKKYDIPIRFNCSNNLLKDKDFTDEYMNLILTINKKFNGYIEIENIELMKYIKKNFPQYKFILSFTNNLQHSYTINFIDELTKQDDFSLIKLPIDFPNLLKIKNKNKIEVIINPSCPFNCNNYNRCMQIEHQNQINYSNKSIIKDCKFNILNKINELPLNDFQYFSFSQGNIDPYFYIDFFIKKEYQFEVLKEYYNG